MSNEYDIPVFVIHNNDEGQVVDHNGVKTIGYQGKFYILFPIGEHDIKTHLAYLQTLTHELVTSTPSDDDGNPKLQ